MVVLYGGSGRSLANELGSQMPRIERINDHLKRPDWVTHGVFYGYSL
jgi:hypothetical protein